MMHPEHPDFEKDEARSNGTFTAWKRVRSERIVPASESKRLLHPWGLESPVIIDPQTVGWLRSHGLEISGSRKAWVADIYPSSQGGATRSMTKVVVVEAGSPESDVFIDHALLLATTEQLDVLVDAVKKLRGNGFFDRRLLIAEAIQKEIATHEMVGLRSQENGVVIDLAHASGQPTLLLPKIDLVVQMDGATYSVIHQRLSQFTFVDLGQHVQGLKRS